MEIIVVDSQEMQLLRVWVHDSVDVDFSYSFSVGEYVSIRIMWNGSYVSGELIREIGEIKQISPSHNRLIFKNNRNLKKRKKAY